MNKRSCVGNGRFFYFNDNGKLDLSHIQKNIDCENKCVLFIEYTWIIWNRKYASVLCVSVWFKDMGWYLGVIGRIHNDECLIYLFTGEVLNGNPNIFTNLQYHCWYKELRDQFVPVLINTTHENVYFWNQVKWNIHRSGKIDWKTTNQNYLCYQFSKDGPDHLLGNSRIRDKKMKHPPPTKKINFMWIQNEIFLKKNNRRKKGS